MVPIKGDGNCFYRALSYQLFGTEDKHLMVRTILYRTENLNKKAFEPHLTNGVSLDEHLRALVSPPSWATQVELAAAASVLGVPLYYLEEKEIYEWNVVKPLSDKQQRPIVKAPEFPVLDEDTTLLRPAHFELFYQSNSHYDAIVDECSNKVCATPPPLSTSSSYLCIE